MKLRTFLKKFYKNKNLLISVSALLVVSLIAITYASAAFSSGSFNFTPTTSDSIDQTSEGTETIDTTSLASQDVINTESTESSAIPAVAIVSSQESIVPPLEQFPDGSKVCYLTFDDGPSSASTPQILEVLSRYNAKATFFVVGTGKLEYLKTIADQGHTIGLHTDSHVYANIYSSYEAYIADLEAISNKVYDHTGIRSTIIRFPGGSSNISSLYKGKCPGLMTRLTVDVEANGYRYFDWNVSTGDADQKLAPPETIMENVKKFSNNKSQICVLMHDTNAKSTTVEALPAVIEYLASQGFEFRALTMDSPVFHHEKLNN